MPGHMSGVSRWGCIIGCVGATGIASEYVLRPLRYSVEWWTAIRDQAAPGWSGDQRR